VNLHFPAWKPAWKPGIVKLVTILLSFSINCSTADVWSDVLLLQASPYTSNHLILWISLTEGLPPGNMVPGTQRLAAASVLLVLVLIQVFPCPLPLCPPPRPVLGWVPLCPPPRPVGLTHELQQWQSTLLSWEVAPKAWARGKSCHWVTLPPALTFPRIPQVSSGRGVCVCVCVLWSNTLLISRVLPSNTLECYSIAILH